MLDVARERGGEVPPDRLATAQHRRVRRRVTTVDLRQLGVGAVVRRERGGIAVGERLRERVLLETGRGFDGHGRSFLRDALAARLSGLARPKRARQDRSAGRPRTVTRRSGSGVPVPERGEQAVARLRREPFLKVLADAHRPLCPMRAVVTVVESQPRASGRARGRRGSRR
jgi:hypothetical protein